MSDMRTRSAVATLVAAAALPAATLVSTTAASGAQGQGSTASGTVFWPSPVQSSGNQSLRDARDADLPVFGAEYRRKVLTDLDGSGRLSYVRVKSSTGPAAKAVGGAFPAYHRDDDR